MKKITWWPAKLADKSIFAPLMVLMRYDWPDQRLYEVGMYTPKALLPWVNAAGQAMGAPDYFTPMSEIVEFINIPPDREYTYNLKPLPETARRRYCQTCKYEPEWAGNSGRCKLSVIDFGADQATWLRRFPDTEEVITDEGNRVMNCTGWEEKKS